MLREAEHILRQHMHKKEFWPRGAMAPQPRFRVLAYFHIYWSKFKILFYACVDEGCSASLTIARKKQI